MEQAEQIMLDNVFWAVMMVKKGEADGMVSGAAHSTADTVRPALQVIKTAPGVKIASSFFVMAVPECSYGYNGTFVFADCGLNRNPNADELSEIALASAKSFKVSSGQSQRSLCFRSPHMEVEKTQLWIR